MITILLLGGALGCTPPSDASLVGLWESEATSRGGIGHSIELKSNGELLSSTIVTVDQVYRVADGELFIAETPKALNAVRIGMTQQQGHAGLVPGPAPKERAQVARLPFR